VSRPIVTPEGQYQVGISIGIAHSRQYPESVESLINAADGAMYVAKRGGKGMVALAYAPTS
jgi:PleD family two-component response regulator